MKYRQLTALLTAAALLLCGCSSVPKTDPGTVPEETTVTDADGETIPLADDALTTMVKAQTVTVPSGLNWFNSAEMIGDKIYCPDADGNALSFSADCKDFTVTELTKLASYDGYFDAGGILSFTADAIYRFAAMENHGGMTPADAVDADYDFWDAYWSDYETDYWLCTYSPDGTLAEKTQITGLESYADEMGQIVPLSLLCDPDGTYLTLMSGEILRISAEGAAVQVEGAPDGTIESTQNNRRFLHDRDGKVILCDVTEETAPDLEMQSVITMREFDTKTGKTGETIYTGSEPFMGQTVMPLSGGCGEYRLFVNNNKKLLGIKDNGDTETVIDWNASDLDTMTVVPFSDGTFFGYGYDVINGTSKFYHLTRKQGHEVGGEQVLTLGVLEKDYGISDFVKAFNRAHTDIRIKLVTYSDDNNHTAIDKLKLAVVSDNAPDLILMYGKHEQFLKLGSKSVFCDLNEYLDKDAEVNRDTLVPNVLTALQHPDGSLYDLASGFVVETIAVKSKFTTKENWTVDDMLDLYEGADDRLYYWSTKEDALNMFLIGTDFTDELNGTCDFDSPDFVKILEFCNRYPAESTQPEKNYDDPVQTEKWQNWFYDEFMKYKRDQDYLYPFSITPTPDDMSASQYAYVKAEMGDDMTLAGYPSNNGQGGKIATLASLYTERGEMGIVTTSPNRDAAWEVIKAYVQDSMEYGEQPGFSILDAQFEEELDGMMYIWENGAPSDREYYDDDVDVYPLTQDERDNLERYIRSCDTFMMLDETVRNIVLEEAGMYFSGDRSAEETAKMIQSRAELYLSEQN